MTKAENAYNAAVWMSRQKKLIKTDVMPPALKEEFVRKFSNSMASDGPRESIETVWKNMGHRYGT